MAATTASAAAEEASVEQLFERCREVPKWTEQITVRALVVSLVLGFFLSFIIMKLNLTTGIIPSFNVSAGLLGFFLVKTWTNVLEQVGVLNQPFTRQENTVIQTCVVACAGVSFSGKYIHIRARMLGMSKQAADGLEQTDSVLNIKEPSLGWMIAFLFLVSFIGLFSILPPSGTATAHLINSFHTPQGALLAKQQVSLLFKSFSASFLWSFFQWFYTAGGDCGFAAFPMFGLKAYKNRFYFDFSATYVGVGMICPYLINISLLLGSIISWGILWPYINSKKGEWYDAALPNDSLHGLTGYKVALALQLNGLDPDFVIEPMSSNSSA